MKPWSALAHSEGFLANLLQIDPFKGIETKIITFLYVFNINSNLLQIDPFKGIETTLHLCIFQH
ncbi:hypothetical protein HCW_07190 [Helicobacter cetorum MIT 00-7128]|uniref:Uncharacterized protein n=1 Tax=Helicobacter cetorum (strain ATCC BAA-429 / MIT 00-7128) TaxID=182217 RepID=I0EP27_HELC0|nr:hypothetical protein HCW_07190 [Helicobacter cetorum MIT 00-7128]